MILNKENDKIKIDLIDKTQELTEKSDKLSGIMQDQICVEKKVRDMTESLEKANKLLEDKDAELQKMDQAISDYENNLMPEFRSALNKLSEKEKLLAFSQTKINEYEALKNKLIEENNNLQSQLDSELQNVEGMKKEISELTYHKSELHKELGELMGIYTILQEQDKEKDIAISNAQLIISQVQKKQQELNSLFLETIRKTLDSNKNLFNSRFIDYKFTAIEFDSALLSENNTEWFESLRNFYKHINAVLQVIYICI